MKLSSRTILITGGTSGIGFELARQLLQRNNTVIVTGRNEDRLRETRRALPDVHLFKSDVSDPDAIALLYQKVLAEFPDLDTLINNAGIMRNLNMNRDNSLSDVTLEIDTNFSGPVRMIQQFLPHLKTQNDALIVNVSSGLAFIPFPASPVYSATKAALHSFTISLRAQLAGTSVTVVDLAPPAVETPLLKDEFAREMEGQKLMNVEILAKNAIAGIEAGKLEILPGLSSVLKLMSRVAPQFGFNLMVKSLKGK